MAVSSASSRSNGVTPEPVSAVDAKHVGEDTVDDRAALTELNLRFVDAFRRGSWELLAPILSPSFSYLDGATGEVWDRARYVADVRKGQPTIGIDQVVVHVDGDVAVVSARSFTRPGMFNRYVDSYQRRANGWLCVHACVWPLR
jgi:hypothetical protein